MLEWFTMDTLDFGWANMRSWFYVSFTALFTCDIPWYCIGTPVYLASL